MRGKHYVKNLFYKPVKESGSDSDFLFWGCLHWHHDPKWEVPLWKMRGFDDPIQHDEAIVSRWNEKASHNTTGFLLGDIIFGRNADVEIVTLLNRLQFKRLYLLPGNHQAGWKQLFESSADNVWHAQHGGEVIFTPNYLEAYVNGQAIVMSHYPILSWNGQGKGSILLYSHVHNSLKNSEIGRMYIEKGLSREVSVETAPYPLSFGDIRREMRNKNSETPDHHGIHTQNPF